jgi:hypothetical protein
MAPAQSRPIVNPYLKTVRANKKRKKEDKENDEKERFEYLYCQ